MKLNKEEILFFLKRLSGNILNILKEIKNTPRLWLYLILCIILTVVFLLFNFPYDTLIKSEFLKIGENAGKSAYIGEMDFSLLGNTTVDALSLVLKDESEINLNKMDLNMGIFSALFSKSLRGIVKASDVKYKKARLMLNGAVKTEFDLDFETYSDYPEGDLNLEIQNVSVNGVTVKGFDIPAVRFSLIESLVKFEKNKLNIDSLKFNGPDLKGNISGSVIFAKSFRQTQLNLSITVDSNSAFLDNYKILLGDMLDKSDKIQLTIRGTAANPKFDYNK